MRVREIVKAHLERYGFDGLFNVDADCACERGDLAPCEDNIIHCEPGYRAQCPRDGYECEACDNRGWHIQREKP